MSDPGFIKSKGLRKNSRSSNENNHLKDADAKFSWKCTKGTHARRFADSELLSDNFFLNSSITSTTNIIIINNNHFWKGVLTM